MLGQSHRRAAPRRAVPCLLVYPSLALRLSSLPPLFSYLFPFKFPSFFFLLVHLVRSFVRPFRRRRAHAPGERNQRRRERYDVARCRGTKSYNHVTIRTYRNHRLSRFLPTLSLLFDHLRASSPSSIEHGLFTCPYFDLDLYYWNGASGTADGLRQHCEQTEMYKSG